MIDILKNQQNIMYVCPSTGWGSRERTLLSDLLSMRDIGHNTFLYCVEGSLLHEKAKNQNIACLFCKLKGDRLNLVLWTKTAFKHYIKKYHISLVHCYELNFLWPLCFYLRGTPLIPLVFTFNHEVKKFYKKFWFKSLLKRVDIFLLPINQLNESIMCYLDIPERKIEFSGMNLEYEAQADADLKVISESINTTSKKYWILGASVSGQKSQLPSLLQLIQLTKYLNTIDLDRPVKLILFSARKWEEFELYPNLSEAVENENLGDDILFRDVFGPKAHFDFINLWISLNPFDLIEDFAVLALLKKIPLLAPRTSVFKELISSKGMIGESYRPADGREVRSKARKILENYQLYQNQIEKMGKDMDKYFQEGDYRESLFKSYNRVLNRRLRYFQQ